MKSNLGGPEQNSAEKPKDGNINEIKRKEPENIALEKKDIYAAKEKKKSCKC